MVKNVLSAVEFDQCYASVKIPLQAGKKSAGKLEQAGHKLNVLNAPKRLLNLC